MARLITTARRAITALRRAWISYRRQCAVEELDHYYQAGVAGPRYICATLAHISDLDSELTRLAEGGAR